MSVTRGSRSASKGWRIRRWSRSAAPPDVLYRGWTINDRGHRSSVGGGRFGLTWTASKRRLGVVNGHTIHSESLDFVVRQIDLFEDRLDWTV